MQGRSSRASTRSHKRRRSRSDDLLEALYYLWRGTLFLFIAGVLAAGCGVLVLIFSSRPDNADALELARRLDLGSMPATSFAPEGWTHVCITDDLASSVVQLRDVAGYTGGRCSGYNPTLIAQPGYGAISFSGPEKCHVVPVSDEILAIAQTICHVRGNILMLSRQGNNLRLTVE